MSQSFQLKPASYSLAKEFNVQVDPRAVITGHEPGHHAVPPKDDGYVFNRGRLRDMLAFWEAGLIGLKLQGDPSTGKSSLPEQFHARLNWPLYKVSCTPTTEAYQLLGQLVPGLDGRLAWTDGPVLRAAREGSSVLLDEGNVMEPGQATSMNLLLDGYCITIPETGEIVTPKPGFRVFWTENPVDSRLVVAGRNVQDAPFEDRWMVMSVDYLPADEEIRVVKNALLKVGTDPNKAELTAKLVVGVANQTRQAYRNRDKVIVSPMSTRSAIRWAKLIRRFQNVKAEEGGPTIYALRRGVSMSPEQRDAVEEYTRAAVGTAP